MSPGLDGYWAAYDATLARIVMARPVTLAALTAILSDFCAPSSGTAFFPGGADETLGDVMHKIGWQVNWIEGDYLWEAWSPSGQEWIHHVEGDVYPGRWRAPVG